MLRNDLPTVVSFYTKTWEYERCKDELVADCNRYHLRHNIQEMPAQEFWFNNTRMKPSFLKKVILEEKRPILWIDVDASLFRAPELFEIPGKYDLMMKRKPESHGRTWHVGTIYLDYNQTVMQFLDRWIEFVEKYPDASDELCLDHLWRAGWMKYLKIADDIPATYFHMRQGDTREHDTVILHRESKGTDKNLR